MIADLRTALMKVHPVRRCGPKSAAVALPQGLGNDRGATSPQLEGAADFGLAAHQGPAEIVVVRTNVGHCSAGFPYVKCSATSIRYCRDQDKGTVLCVG